MSTRRIRPRRRFMPGATNGLDTARLEPRIVLNGGGGQVVGAPVGTTERPITNDTILGSRVSPVLIGDSSRGVIYRDSATTRVTDAIDRSFDSFTTDYLQAQGAYLATKVDPNNTTVTAEKVKDTFDTVTEVRVNLLAQELTQILTRVPGFLKRTKGQSANTLQKFLSRRITSQVNGSESLIRQLLDTASPPLGSTGSLATLYTLSATNAIEAARVATQNATKFSASGVFRR